MKRLVFFSLMVALSANMLASDFEEGGIYYNITNEMTMTCEVTYLSYKSTDNGSAYSGNLVIPATVNYDDKTYTVTGIGQYAFYECRDLISIEIPDYVTSIGTYAFYYCNSLTSITFPDYLISVGDYAFRYCSQLSEISMGNSVSSLGSYVFRDCTSLTSVEMPNSIFSLGQGTFYDCTGIEEVTMPKAITSIPSYTFFDCQNLTSINLPDSLTSIGSNGFKSCSSLTSIKIPEGVASISTNAFQYCTSLSSINLPSHISTIANFTFNGCTALEKIYAYNPSPATVNNANAFEGVDKGTCVLYVPIGSNEEYETATVWKEFQNIVEMVEFSIETLEATDVTDTSATLNGSVIEGYDDPITEKGFEYWVEGGESISVVVDGEEMVYILEDLSPETTYIYHAFASTESGTAYGEEKSFTTLFDVEGLYNELVDELDETSDLLNETWGTITSEYGDVEDQFVDDYNALVDELESLLKEVEDAYNDGTLTKEMGEDIRAKIEEILQQIEELLAAAKEAHEIASGIESVLSDTNGEVQIFNVAGVRLDTSQHGVNIVRMSDGTMKKILIK